MNSHFSLGEITPIKYFFGIGLLLVALFTFVGEDENLLFSFTRWFIQVLIPLFLIIALHVGLSKLNWFNRQNPWLQLALSGVMGAVLFCPLALQFDLISGLESLGDRAYLAALFEEFTDLVVPVTLAWIGMNSPWLLGYQLVRKEPNYDTHSNHKETDVLPAREAEWAPFMQLIPKAIRAPLLYMKSELHYLSVHTEKGKALILYNLKDAERESASTGGIKPHRSYWVAKKAVKSFEKKGREGTLQLIDGSEIPVSRSKVSVVRALVESRAH